MRLAFMGSPDFSVPALRALHEAGHEIAAVYCQPPRPAGRGQKEAPCPVHRAALELGLPVRTPARVRKDTAEHEAFAALDLDVAVVAAYGLILPPAMLEAPRQGCLNIHASLLPRWRGAGPIQAAILAGDTESGITIMRMEEGLDTGPMLLRDSVPIGPRTTTPELHDALAALGGPLVLRALEENPPPVPQPEEGVTYAPKLGKEDGRLDWTQDAAALDRRVRALNPWPGTFFRHGEDVIRLLAAEPEPGDSNAAPGTVLDGMPRIACGNGVLRLTRLQRAGRGAMPADAFLRGYPLPPGTVLD
ncbi:methionyl-tRNA formyltransferase [Pseudoroseomonas ludipueritiae]|uniref:Methionyl-tRNA formyltransferase n=1 Tax=Pseudoroseomonas ludipueritiae TaxID=198093 RepID=A0ABR7RD80_9PROT|nr:methionyl-tRNA formyltransferase [Pseudoroseomonas ludipueritiae]MBC9179400.1 methionyl-tRNA formyltransferase [Pseudoroseomonas ludipueritiae]